MQQITQCSMIKIEILTVASERSVVPLLIVCADCCVIGTKRCPALSIRKYTHVIALYTGYSNSRPDRHLAKQQNL